ncbi:HAMP domain-containing histidine kinase [Pedobacter sp. MC2016-14]|uniref:sensor histidine kinase n=1 Tax=Pedobacter sp. MC2016-14 TaxID=2897327 RepID=UPI001E536049|nr:HAMP domain-containing sensor histidine kinase [Pedobacter sp. MC2016-14]MCD0487126.1 HAMP domain-containing histidine kinase [Pedobacter sp. MC2016-14]
MSIGGKIRFLLLILGMCCIVTAISLKHSVTKKDLLAHEAALLQKNLNASERLVHNFLSNKSQLTMAKQLHVNEAAAMQFINSYRAQGINLLVYEHGELQFWSSYKAVMPLPDMVKEGTSFLQLANGWYEVIKKTQGNFAFIFLIDVKNQFVIENRYLKNEIDTKLSPSGALTMASFTDDEVYGIKSAEGKLLFEVKLNAAYSTNLYASVEFWLWVVGLFSFSLFVNSFCAWLAKRGHHTLATLLMAGVFVLIRLTDLQFGWFNHQFNLAIFKPYIYAESFFMPSLGDFLLNVVAITWITLFMYTYKDGYRLPQRLRESKVAAWIIQLLLLIAFSGLAFVLDSIFFGLVYNSKINFDITNIINLDWISWVCIVILCLVWFNIYLIASIFLQLSKSLNTTNRERLILFLTAFLAYFIYRINTEFTVFFIAFALFILLMGYNRYVKEDKFSIGVYAALFFCIALISSIKYQRYNDIKERNHRYLIAQKLQSSDDPKIINSVESLERGLSSDPFIVSYFKKPLPNRNRVLQNFIDKKFLDGYLSQFEYNLYEFNSQDSSIKNNERVPLSHYKSLVKAGSVKVSNFFYRLNDTFGYQNYFGIVPVFEHNRVLGTMVIEFKSQQYNYNSQFPELLMDGKIKSDEDYDKYSLAFYNNGRLIGQSGKFTYKLDNTDFKHTPGEALYLDDTTGYNHLVYMPSSTKVIVISKEKTDYVVRLATLSFFFLVFTLFSVALYICIWLMRNIDESWGGWFNINRSLMINANKILYKTRIQFSIVLSVVATLLIVGWTTFFYISSEYRKQQDDLVKEKIRKVQLSYEKQIFNTGIPAITEQSKVDFNQFANVNASFLNLFDINGNLLYTSLPKMFEYGIISPKMGPKAYVYLHQVQRSDYLNPAEKIGSFIYSSAYAPIRNAQNQTVAYVGLAYYGNEADYQAKIGLFINTLINIYALVFVAIGVLAVFLANQITNPLTFIQESIRKTKLGQKNKPIQWARHDEIGALVKEYNKMIAALEESAARLARSERESAWREMAKQVAHEIKNPLTPLKLGVQLLEKSWREKDPNFEKKFERFNKSFIEQIDTLANIASEFSNFAKMPDAKLEKLMLLPIISRSKDLFADEPAEIRILNLTDRVPHILGDKDQLVRSFSNLLKNAIEATVEGESIISIRINNDKDTVWVEIKDNGKGIDPDLQDKIFAPNFTTNSSGTGLGLAFVKQAIENAGGTIDFKSVPEAGTTFYLSFPLV